MKISLNAASSAVDELAQAKQAPDMKEVQQILYTAIVVVFLEKKMQDEEETWDLVVEKARTWLGSVAPEEFLAEVWRMAESVVGV
jgi:hypothetical protein